MSVKAGQTHSLVLLHLDPFVRGQIGRAERDIRLATCAGAGGTYMGVSRSRKIGLVLASAPGAAACVFVALVAAGQGVTQASLWATVLGLPVALAGAGAAVWAIAAPPGRARRLRSVPVPGWVVNRPTEA